MRIEDVRLLCGMVGALVLSACAAAGGEIEEPVDDPSVAAEFKELSVPDKAELLAELRAELDAELLTPDPELLLEHAALAQTEGVRFNRLLNRGLFDGVTLVRGGGAYFSFTSLTNDYNQGPDLELQGWSFSSGFAGGNWGHVVRLDAQSLLEVGLEDVPAELQAEEPPPRSRKRPEVVEVGSVHAVRSIRLGESDLLVALEVLQRDENGVTFAWKMLAEFAVPEYSR
jgi:hypothetical protein